MNYKLLAKFRMNLPLDTEEKTMENVAKMIGVSKRTLSRAENGEKVSKKSEGLIELFYSQYYGAKVKQLKEVS